MSLQTVISFSNLQQVEVVYRNKMNQSDMPILTSSQDAYDHFSSIWSHNMDRLEEFYILMLNRANKVLGYCKISQGGISGTVADPKIIYQTALVANASSIILAHNHPSGQLQPSECDINLTKSLCQAGKFLELNVLDHLIISSDTYFSFADEGLI